VSFLEYLFYLTFFPVVFAGPITRAETFFPQIRRRRPLSQYMAYQGLWLILMGMIKKAVIADYIAQYNNWIFDSPLTYSGFECLMGLWGFSLQIYLDFSGYSDISIGIAALMGIRLRDNFRFPYQSRNVTEFWHRWHISLSTWFRDYVYIPLGGNRCGISRTALNCLITLLVAGIWHGSSLMFVLWGLLHGLALVVHKSLLPQLRRIPDVWCIRALSTLLTITFITVSWVLFRAPDLSTAGELLGQMFTSFHPEVISSFVSVRFTWVMMTLLSTLLLFVSERAYNRMTASFVLTPWLVKLLLFTAVLLLAVEFHTSSITPFLYYKF
jgi:D-alanyl-lipoteichoic acid acyltransferase DltB (MBOAT superfamily)